MYQLNLLSTPASLQDSRFSLFAFLTNIFKIVYKYFNVLRGDLWKPPGL